MSDDVCSFCLGDDTDVPPMGRLKDARDFVLPCSTCRIIAHRKCLMDWFNSIPPDKVSWNNDNPDVGSDSETNHYHISIPPPLVAGWVNALAPDQQHGPDVLVSASCPQCKSPIQFRMKQLALITFLSLTRTTLRDLVNWGAVFFGVSGAVTGVFTLGYVGLARVGLGIMDAMIPQPIFMNMITRRNTVTFQGIRSFFPISRDSYATLEDIITKGLLDQFKFAHIQALPLAMFKMRSLSIVSCIVNPSVNAWGTEIVLSNFFLAIGNHKLIGALLSNARRVLVERKLSLLTRGLSVWDPNVMIGMIVPVRWAYDVLYHLTINRVYFDHTAAIRPHDIANANPEADVEALEAIRSRVAHLELVLERRDAIVESRIYKQSFSTNPLVNSVVRYFKYRLTYYRWLWDDNLPWLYTRAVLKEWYRKAKACLRSDYSRVNAPSSLAVRAVTTVVWPFVSADIGKLIYKFVMSNRFSHIPKDRVVMMSNLIALLVVVIGKDLFNVYLSSHKVNHLSRLLIVKTPKDSPSLDVEWRPTPGAFPE